jgi:hypothetical protein
VWADVRCVATDGAKCFYGAFREHLPSTPHLRCRFHIRANLRKKFRSSVKWPDFNRQFHFCMHEPSLGRFEKKWKQMLKEHPASAAYMTEHLWPIREQWASCWTNAYCTIGANSTQRVESLNALVKRFVRPTFPVKDLFLLLHDISLRQAQAVVESVAKDGMLRGEFENPVYDDARVHLTRQAAALLHREGVYRENYVCQYLLCRPNIKWTEDINDQTPRAGLLFDLHCGVDFTVNSSVDSAVDASLQSPIDSTVDSAVDPRLRRGGWLVVIARGRLDKAGTTTHLPHWVVVTPDGATCSGCHFTARYLLPCRHILAVNLKLWPGRAFQSVQCHRRWFLNKPLVLQRRDHHSLEEQALCDGPDPESEDVSEEATMSINARHNLWMAEAEHVFQLLQGVSEKHFLKAMDDLKAVGEGRAQQLLPRLLKGGRKVTHTHTLLSTLVSTLLSTSTCHRHPPCCRLCCRLCCLAALYLSYSHCTHSSVDAALRCASTIVLCVRQSRW